MPYPPPPRAPGFGQGQDRGRQHQETGRQSIFERLSGIGNLPMEIRYAYLLWLSAAALGVVLAASALIGAISFYGRGALPLDVPSLIASILAAGAITYLALRMKERSRWARTVLTGLGILSAVISLFSITTIGMGIIPTLAQAAATILIWQPAARRWFTANSWPEKPSAGS